MVVFRIALGMVFVGQILLTALVNNTWPKWLPAAALTFLMAMCVIGYGLSGWCNWAFIILFAAFGMLLAADGVAAVFGVLLRRLQKKKFCPVR